jgi:DNA-binding CsgD family transcriptional regulator
MQHFKFPQLPEAARQSLASTDDVFSILEGLSRTDKVQEGTDLLKSALERFGLQHVVYIAMNIPTQATTLPLLSVTYTPEWQRHYQQQNFIDIDPVIRAGLGGLLPIDWADIDRSHRMVQRFFGEAQEFDIGSQGLSFPIRGRHYEFGLFSVTSQLNDREWARIKPLIMPEIMLISHHFHQWALQRTGVEVPNYAERLSLREKECLRWRAVGKSDWDISQIMTISERTVKFHLENARAKLDAMNTTHAVAKALSCGAISLF